MGFNIGRWLGHVIKGAAQQVGPEIVQAAASQLPPDVQSGFNQAAQFIKDPKLNINSVVDLTALRDKFVGPNLKGFDLAASLYGGLSRVGGVLPPNLTPVQQAGYLMTQGMADAHPDNKAAMMTAVAATPALQQGAVVAVKQVAATRKGWWWRFLHALGLAH